MLKYIVFQTKKGADPKVSTLILYRNATLKKWIVEAILKLVADFGCGAYLAYVSNPKSSKMPKEPNLSLFLTSEL